MSGLLVKGFWTFPLSRVNSFLANRLAYNHSGLELKRIGATMTQKAPSDTHLNWLALLLALFLAFPVGAYDDIPHSTNAIREAYFLGTRQGGLTPDILAPYAHWISQLKEGTCTSQARLETPFLQVADYAGKAANYSSQDAVKEFYGKQMVFRVYLDICYKPDAPLNAIKIKVIQNKKEIIPLSEESSPYIPRVDELATLPPNGEQIHLEFKSSQIDSSTLTFRINTPGKQYAEVDFDLQTLR
jgi:hypothetical protein